MCEERLAKGVMTGEGITYKNMTVPCFSLNTDGGAVPAVGHVAVGAVQLNRSALLLYCYAKRGTLGCPLILQLEILASLP